MQVMIEVLVKTLIFQNMAVRKKIVFFNKKFTLQSASHEKSKLLSKISETICLNKMQNMQKANHFLMFTSGYSHLRAY